MRRESVPPRSKALGWAIIATTVAGPLLFLPLCPIQELPRARVGISGHVDSPVDEPVTLTVQLPQGYGLSNLERRQGWPELNKTHSTQIVLDGSSFEIRLPPASYCVTRFRWQDTPPPPLWIALSLSNAPDETYVVWTTPQGGDYGVVAEDGTRKTKGEARWRLHLGDYHQDEAGEAWLLDVRLERGVGTDTPGAENLARARGPGRTMGVPMVDIATQTVPPRDPDTPCRVRCPRLHG